MIAFKEIFDDQLPVGRGRIASGMGYAGISDSMIVEDRPHIAKGCVEIIRFILAHIDENEAVKDTDMAGKQAVLCLVKIFRHQASGEQFAVQPECPGMVRANKLGRIATFGLTNG